MRIFETEDKLGKIIFITQKRWIHICKEHPEISSYLKEFEDTLKNPTKIIMHEFYLNIKFYYKFSNSSNDKNYPGKGP